MNLSKVLTMSAAAIVAALVVSGSLAAQQNQTPVSSAMRNAFRAELPAVHVLQERHTGTEQLSSVLASLGTRSRVLMIGAHPDDEDTELITWLARSRHVETAYLSLTRGDGGQNLIGNELGEQLGMIRTQELLAARRIDGGSQFFSRAFDFGFSKDEHETFEFWPRDSILGDVVKVVRSFRPHVIIAVFTGTPRDGHGHHRVSGIIAREAWDRSSDTVAFPVQNYGIAWSVPKFYRAARFTPDEMTMQLNVGEYSPIHGRSFAEIAGESRSQHKSQGFGSLQRRGAQLDWLLREATRVNNDQDARWESSIFDGIDTTWSHLSDLVANSAAATLLDSANLAFTEARRVYRSDRPSASVAFLARGLGQLRRARDMVGERPPFLRADRLGRVPRLLRYNGVVVTESYSSKDHVDSELWTSIEITERRASQALVMAAGIAVEASTNRQFLPALDPSKTDVPDSTDVSIQIFNRGKHTVVLQGLGFSNPSSLPAIGIAPDSAMLIHRQLRTVDFTLPWWRVAGKNGSLFQADIDERDERSRQLSLQPRIVSRLIVEGTAVDIVTPVVHRFADPVKGDMRIPVSVVPGITVGLERTVEYARAGHELSRVMRVNLLSVYPEDQQVSVILMLPDGVVADSAERIRTLRPNEIQTVSFFVRGQLSEGLHEVEVRAIHAGQPSIAGYSTVQYDHIEPQLSYSASRMYYSAVPITVPQGLSVGYVTGTSDDGISALKALGIPVEELSPVQLLSSDLDKFTAIVIGPRAYQTIPSLRNINPRLFSWVRQGGNLVVQYGQFEMQEEGYMPFPVSLSRPAERVTHEDVPVRITNSQSDLLRFPNVIGESDWGSWFQERAVYMPSSFDGAYTSHIEMNDPNEPANRSGLLSVRMGQGVYVYTTLALFRQLPYGVPGGARLLVNLLSARPNNHPVSGR